MSLSDENPIVQFRYDQLFIARRHGVFTLIIYSCGLARIF